MKRPARPDGAASRQGLAGLKKAGSGLRRPCLLWILNFVSETINLTMFSLDAQVRKKAQEAQLFCRSSCKNDLRSGSKRPVDDLVGEAGVLLGMLNTHCASVRSLAPREEQALDRIARRTASWLEGLTT